MTFRRAAWVVVGLLVIGGLLLGLRKITGSSQAVADHAAHEAVSAIPVTAAIAKRQNFTEISDFFGNVQSIDTVSIIPRVTGAIEKIEFNPGQDVKAGQELFLIDPRPYQAVLDEAEGQLTHDQGLLAEAKIDLQRYQKLLSQNSISAQTAQDQRYVVQQDEGTVQLDQANIEAAQLNLEYCHVTAPISGRAGILQVDLGNLVGQSGNQSLSGKTAASAQPTASATSASDALVSITQLQPIYVTFSIPQTLANEIIRHQAESPLEVEAFSQTGQLLEKGRLDIIDNQVNTATGTLTLQASFANANQLLWPGEYVSVQLTSGVLEHVVTIPSSAIMVGPNGDYVYVIDSANKVKRVDVEEAQRQAGISVIRKGVSPGQMVVTTGQYRLTDGSVVTVQPATSPDDQTQNSAD